MMSQLPEPVSDNEISEMFNFADKVTELPTRPTCLEMRFTKLYNSLTPNSTAQSAINIFQNPYSTAK